MQKLNRPDLALVNVIGCLDFSHLLDCGFLQVLAVFPSNAKDRYDAFKEALCCNLPCGLFARQK